MRRRAFLGGILQTGAATCACRAHAAAVGSAGCYIGDDDLAAKLGNSNSGWSFDVNRDPLFGGSGDKEFDRALAHTLSELCDLFSILPGFAFFNEDEGPNAFASPSQRLHRADGSVVFGQQLLRQLLTAPEHPAAGVAAVCAHEFGHILQYQKGLERILVGPDRRVKRLELHADFLAGYFAGHKRLTRPDFPAAVFANTQFYFGDGQLSNPNHHGTREERGAAVVTGYQAAFRDRKSVAEAVEIGIQYVRGVPS